MLAGMAFGGWLRAGSVKERDEVFEGMENVPTSFAGMLKGANFGKQLVRVGPDKV